MQSPMLLLLFLCSMILAPFSILAQINVGVKGQNRSNIKIGDTLSAENSNSSWVVSPSGDFAFGFLPLQDTDFFLLSIWYAKIPEQTIVWYANGDNPAPKGSKVELNADDGLILSAPNGDQLWKTVNLTGKVANGFLNNTGNFVLNGRDSGSVWETFKNPKDTLLPSQILEIGGKLSSRFLESNFSRGRFELLLQGDGILSIHALNLPSDYVNENLYEALNTEPNATTRGIRVVFDSSGYLYILRKTNGKFNFSNQQTGVSTADSYLRATLNIDGVFTFYQYPKNSFGGDGWSPVWSQPDNICLTRAATGGSGICGFNSYCTMGNDKRATCQCPTGYSLVDPNDPYGSCKPDFILGCAEDELIKGKDEYDLEELLNSDWPLSEYLVLSPFTEEECKQSCLEDCMCAVAIFESDGSCLKKKLPLSNGRVDPAINDGRKTFMKVGKDNSSFVIPLQPSIVHKNRKTLILVGSVLLGSSAFVNIILIGAICLSFSFIFRYKKKAPRGDNAVETNLRCFTYKELEEATNDFQKELGRGSFGVVYEGVIDMASSKTLVAVKKLNSFVLQEVEKEFKNELNVIGLTHHKNLVRLIGFCEAGSERLLVYEYMSNGTLARLLFNGVTKPSWKLRLDIAFGIARGLAYMHEECSTQIIHCDIKPQNILLDNYYNARISDFGLAKLLKMNQSRTNTAIRGTKGYVAVEWFKSMPITAKVDVYSYGVLLLEIICCRRCVEMQSSQDEKAILTDWAYDCYTGGAIDALVKDDKEALDDKGSLEKLVMIAIWCVQEDPNLRPTMRKVTQMLEGVVQVQAPPYPPSSSAQS